QGVGAAGAAPPRDPVPGRRDRGASGGRDPHRPDRPDRSAAMIYPTSRAVLLMAVGAPVALLIGLMSPGYWVVGGGWAALIVGLVLLDAFVGPARAKVELTIDSPRTLGMAGEGALNVKAAFG